MTPGENGNGKKAILLVMAVASYLAPVMTSSVNVALPAIGKDFGIDVVMLGWVGTVFILASAAMLLPLGKLSDMYGKRRIFTFGMIVLTLGLMLAVLSVSGAMLIVSRAIQGIGGAAIFTTSIAILASAYPSQQRGRVLGIATASVYLGLSTGPFLGGFLTHYAGWRSVFLFGFVLSLLTLIATLWKLKTEPVEGTNEKFDFAGSIVYSFAMVLTLYGVSNLPTATGVWFTVLGLAGGGLFLWRQSVIPHPILRLGLFRHNRVFTYSNLAAMASFCGTWSVTFLLSLYLQYAKGLDAHAAGIILVATPAMQIIVAPISGWLSDRVEPRIISSTGMAVTSLGTGLLIFLDISSSIGYVVLCLLVVGLGSAVFAAPNTNTIMGSVDRKLYNTASATLATTRQIGMITSVGISLLLFSIFIGRVEITAERLPDLINATRTAFLISTVLCFSTIFLLIVRGNIRANGKATKT